jgi:hypothetical protein
MAVHTYITRTVIHHEWVLGAPAHESDVLKAVNVAAIKQRELSTKDVHTRVGDIYITGRDDELVVSFTEEQR